jgi:multidrug efflux pump subunit AcrB
MLFTVLFVVGVAAYLNVPVSLLPDVAIPEITVRISGQNVSARELENTAVAPVRQQLLQVSRLRDVRSETRDGTATIRLSFEYGANTDLAFIEVNEKVDGAMRYLPKEVERPLVVKASAADIPVLTLNLTLKDSTAAGANRKPFSELSRFAENVVRRRIEQLPQVAMADVTGLVKDEVTITPHLDLLEAGAFTLSDIESALSAYSYTPGSMTIHDGYYEYNIRFSDVLRTVEDIRNVYFAKHDRVYQLKDVARVEQTAEKEKGMATYNGKRAVALSVIKQSEAGMTKMQEAIGEVVEQLGRDYPEVSFDVSQNQTELLDYTISNLKQNLLLAFLFVCMVSAIFLRDAKSPLIIGLSMFVSLVVSFFFFHLFHISLNVVSLTGLILALGMMIDNSIIVTDNIGQHRAKHLPLGEACARGASEVVAPMLSSMLTTIAIFVPLIFLSGIAGALFSDQAFSVTVGLLVSYITGVALLPVLYKLVYSAPKVHLLPKIAEKVGKQRGENPENVAIFRIYDCCTGWVFRHKALTAIIMLAIFPVCFALFTLIRKEKMPDLHQNEMSVTLEWNENIHVEENYERSMKVCEQLSPEAEETSGLIGQQQLMLGGRREQTSSEAEIYVKAKTSDDIPLLKGKVEAYLSEKYPRAQASFAPTGTIFEKIFSTGEADFVVEYFDVSRQKEAPSQLVAELKKQLTGMAGAPPEQVSLQHQLNFKIDREKLLLYKVQHDEVYRALKTAFRENRVTTLRSEQQYLPIALGGDVKSVKELMAHTLVDAPPDPDGRRYKLPLSAFVEVTPATDLKTIFAGKSGEYIPFVFQHVDNADEVASKISEESRSRQGAEVSFSGSVFSNKKMLNELAVILLISILLMYLILAAQFENFVQPLIVLAEIPIDVAAALGLLMATGHSLNLMSAIGIIVTCGIIINDSILKVDVMNTLRKSGMPLMEAIHEAGRRRLKAILMTSLTSIVCMLPLFFSSNLGAELEKPLAIATIGGMIIGTPVSLFVVPLLYWRIYRSKELKT